MKKGDEVIHRITPTYLAFAIRHSFQALDYSKFD
jgi:hypothetical protein